MEQTKYIHSLKTTATRGMVLAVWAASVLFTTTALTSCVKDDLYNTPHPDHGKITVTANWNDRGDGVEIPASWNINMGNYSGTETQATHAPSQLFNPGNYRLTAFSDADNITVSGTTATVATANGINGVKAPFVNSNPGFFFTNVQEVTIEKDRDHVFTAAMQQQVREVTILIEPTDDAKERIESIEGYLSGVAGTLDFANNAYGSASNVALSFTKVTQGNNIGKWRATIRLLGITGSAQKLTATISYANGNPLSSVLESDLSKAINGFNDNKKAQFILGGTIAETPSESVVGGATIENWTQINAGNGDAY